MQLTIILIFLILHLNQISTTNKSKLRQNTETILLISKVLSESVRP